MILLMLLKARREQWATSLVKLGRVTSSQRNWGGELIILLDKINYLVHKYFKLEITRFYSELGQKEMIKYFCDFIHDSEEIDHELKSYYTIYTEKLGITDDKIEKLMADMKANG